MSKLEIKENKKLVLKNVVVSELRAIAIENLDNEIHKFVTQMQVLNVKTFGPLITHNRGINIHEDGTATIDYDIIIQAHDYQQYKNSYKVFERLTCEHCAYVRFDDHPQYINFAYSKLDLYFYENDLEAEGNVYNIHISESEERMTVDIFKPVRTL